MVAIVETWTGADGAAWPAQWVAGLTGTGSSATIQGNAGRLRTTGGGYAGNAKIARRLSTALPDFDQVFEFWHGDTAEKYPQFAWRADNALDGVAGYFLTLRTNPSVTVSTNYTATAKGSTTFAITANTHYHARVKVSGSSHKVKFWSGGLGAEPATGGVDGAGYQISFTDSTYTTGAVGVILAVGNTATTSDLLLGPFGEGGAATTPAAAGGWQLGSIAM